MVEYIIGVDGGNSKTDVVIASTSGRVLARQRGPGVLSPLQAANAWRTGLISLIEEARAKARIRPTNPAQCAVYFLANVDLPTERRIARRELTEAGVARVTVVQNDTFAVLRAGASRSWGVAVVAGAGINGVGVHPTARVARFLGLGDITGDCGGGQDIGRLGLAAAVRARDGRGPATVLATEVPRYYGLRTPMDVAAAVHFGTIAYHDLHVLAPLVFAASAAGDPVARRIIDGFADEVAVMANALIRRLHLTRTDVEVVLGGGTLQTGNGAVLSRVTEAITALAPRARVTELDVAPVAGAVVDALDRVGASDSSRRRVKAALRSPSPT
jgi:N-acetylglucosamine kinase-like BadF-type ATPase